jgi:hypothetical protein
MLADTLPALLQRLDPRGARLWGPGLVRAMLRAEQPDPARPVHLYVCIADHFEPRWRRPSVDEERARVARWERDYPALADRHRDSDGRPHVRTLFFPAEEYRPEHLDALVRLKDKGLVDVELHLHHDHDTRDNLRTTLTDFAALLHREHGCLRRDAATGQVRYAFIHGNWALDNGHGGGEFCGVDDELSVLVETGCYLDMTMPCVPSPAQSRIVNEIYYARSAPGRSRGYDRGRTVHVGGAARPGELMLIPGPLGVLLGSRVKGLVPRIEAAMLEPENPVPAPLRVASWMAHAPTVRGAPNHRFVKLHAHGCNGDAPDWFLTPDGPFERLLDTLEARCRADGVQLHYVTAHEMYETVQSLEDGSRLN